MNAKVVVAVAVVLLVAGGAALYTYLNADEAQEASVTAALGADEGAEGEQAGDETDAAQASEGEDGEAAPSGEEATSLADATGEWKVSTDIGTFDVLEASSTFVGFRVDEELNNIGAVEAVGRTPVVVGELTIDGTTLQAASIQADFTAMVSDRANRVGAMKRAMGVGDNPVGTFVLTEPVDFGEVPPGGDVVQFAATGDLTVNGVTSAVTLDMEASVDAGNIIVAGSAPVVFADFDIEAPTAGPVVSVDQEGTVEVQVWFVPA